MPVSEWSETGHLKIILIISLIVSNHVFRGFIVYFVCYLSATLSNSINILTSAHGLFNYIYAN